VEERYVGTWDGRSMLAPGDTGVPWSMVLSVADSELAGTLTFSGTSLVPVGIRTVALTESTLVQEVGPYYSPTAGAEVMTRASARLTSDSTIEGSFVMQPTAGGDTIAGTYRAQRMKRP
jgi:hypothetical protein